MSFLKRFYAKGSLKRKILDIKDEIAEIIKPMCKEKFWINWYGAYDIDPKNLVFWVCVESDKMKTSFESDEKLMKRLRDLLEKYDYPLEARPHVAIGYESQETVDRKSNGDWYVHFK